MEGSILALLQAAWCGCVKHWALLLLRTCSTRSSGTVRGEGKEPGAGQGAGQRQPLSLRISFSCPRTQHIKAIKKSSAQRGDFEGKYECKDTAFLDQRGEIAEGKLNTAGMSIRNRLIPQDFFFLSVLYKL